MKRSYCVNDLKDEALALYLQPNYSKTGFKHNCKKIAEMLQEKYKGSLPIGNIRTIMFTTVYGWERRYGWKELREKAKTGGIVKAFEDYYKEKGDEVSISNYMYYRDKLAEDYGLRDKMAGSYSKDEDNGEAKMKILSSFGIVPDSVKKLEDQIGLITANMENRSMAYLSLFKPVFQSILYSLGKAPEGYIEPRDMMEMNVGQKMQLFDNINRNLREDEQEAMSRMQRKLTEAKGKYGYTEFTPEQIESLYLGVVGNFAERCLRPSEEGIVEGEVADPKDIPESQESGGVRRPQEVGGDEAVDAIEQLLRATEDVVQQ